MLNGVIHDKRQKHNNKRSAYERFSRQAAALLRQAYRFQSAADLACKVPLVVGALVVLLIINTGLQYAAGPALHKALPTRDARGRPTRQQHNTAHGSLAAGVVPGGADAELLCADKQTKCDKERCSVVSYKYHQCKATCSSCEELQRAVQADTGLQVRVVQQLSGCADLHPACAAWQQGGKCSKEPKAMLELCQASCGFCQPPAVSPLAADVSASSSGSSDSSSSSSGSNADGLSPGVLLDECQDDINVCPYLAATGLCGGGSLWVDTQCARSCGRCSTGLQPADAHNSSSGSSSSSSSSSSAAAPLVGEVVGAGSPSSVVVVGRHRADAPTSSHTLMEWKIPGCRDHQSRCVSWARAGECSSNIDYMMISCKASCNNCGALQTTSPFSTLQLSSGWLMPTVGFGTAGLGVGTTAAVEYAAAAGYRMFDSAESKDWYDEEAVGAGLAASKVPRDQLFLISKIHPRDLGYQQTLAAASRALSHLQTTYLDLLLLHYPACFPGANCIPDPTQSWQESWKALEDLVSQGKVRSIGVSNFGLSELQQLLSLAKVPPAVLESRSDPFAINHHAIQAALRHNMTFIGYSTLGTQWINSPVSVNPVFNSSLLQAIAAHHPGKSLVQVVLRWALQLGQVVIPRSSNPDHIPLNLQLFDFSLSDGEMAAINGLDGTWKTGGLPLPVA